MKLMPVGPTGLRRPFLAVYAPAEHGEPRLACAGESRDIVKAIKIAEERRHLDCAQYDTCLNLAVREDWPGFECVNCALFPRRPR